MLEIISGKGGHTKVAQIKTVSGELLRLVLKLYNLEIPKKLSNDSVLWTRSGRIVTVAEHYKTGLSFELLKYILIFLFSIDFNLIFLSTFYVFHSSNLNL